MNGPHRVGCNDAGRSQVGQRRMTRRSLLRGVALGVSTAPILPMIRPASVAALPDGAVSVLANGVTSDDGTDQRQAIQRVIDTFSGSRVIFFPPGRYRIGTAGAKGPNRIRLRTGTYLAFSEGAVIEVNAVDQQSGSSIFFAGGADGTKSSIPADAVMGERSVALPGRIVRNLAVGDIVGLESFGIAGDSGGYPWYVREFHRVTAIGASGTVTIDTPLEYSYLRSDRAVAWRVATVDDVTIDGAVFECGPGVTAGTDGTYAIGVSKAANLRIRNVVLTNMIGGISIHDCYGGSIVDCTVDGLPRYGSPYGYGVHVGGSSAMIRVDNLRGSRIRHLFTTLSDDRGEAYWGGPMRIQVNNGVGYGAKEGFSIWDTHEFGRHIEFNHCVATGGGSAVSGFQIRAQDVTLNNCTARENGKRAVVLTNLSKRVRIFGGDFGHSGSQGIAAAGESHEILDAFVHDCIGAGIAIDNSENILVQGCTIVNNAYGLQDAGGGKHRSAEIKESLNAKIENCIIPFSERQKISMLDLSSSAVVANVQCRGFGSTGGLRNSKTGRWEAPLGAVYSILTDDGWVSNRPANSLPG